MSAISIKEVAPGVYRLVDHWKAALLAERDGIYFDGPAEDWLGLARAIDGFQVYSSDSVRGWPCLGHASYGFEISHAKSGITILLRMIDAGALAGRIRATLGNKKHPISEAL